MAVVQPNSAGEIEVRIVGDDDLKTTLLTILGIVNDWLKFAEAKNAGIVGFASAALALLLAFLRDRTDRSDLSAISVSVAGICFLGSLVVGLASFFPRTKYIVKGEDETDHQHQSDNLFFFGDLAQMTPGELPSLVANLYCEAPDTRIKKVHLDIATQIIINARITMWKLKLFGISAFLFGAGAISAAIGVSANYL